MYCLYDDYCCDFGFFLVGNILVICFDDFNVYVYDFFIDNILICNLKGYESWVMVFDWLEKGCNLVIVDNGGVIIVYVFKSGEQKFFNLVELEIFWIDVEFLLNGEQFIVVSGYELVIYDLDGIGFSVCFMFDGVIVGGGVEGEKLLLEFLLESILLMVSQLYFLFDNKMLGVIDVDYGLQVINMEEGIV